MRTFLLLWLLGRAAFASSQTITNPGFERPDTTATGLAAWTCNLAGAVERDTTERHSGLAALRISHPDLKNYTVFRQEIPFPPGPGLRHYRLSGYLRGRDITGYAALKIDLYAGSKHLYVDYVHERRISGTTDWTALETDFFADETATHVVLGGLLYGSGTAWFDALDLREIPLPAGPLPDSLRNYLDDALTLMQRHALYRDSVHWPTISERTRAIAAGATSYVACYPALHYAVAKLGDNHSFLRSAQLTRQFAPAEEAKPFQPATGEIIDSQFAYVNLPSFVWGSADASGRAFSAQLHTLLAQLDSLQPTGWILDLRQNGGGSCWPMLAGIGPLLGEGVCGYFVAPGTKPKPWFYRQGRAGVGKNKVLSRVQYPVRLRTAWPPVAVLTSPRTASAGEVVVTAFRGRPNTRHFGEPTAGVSTGNAGFPLRDGATLFLAVSAYADRTGRVYGGKILPDEVAPGDTAMAAAKRWLIGF